MKYSSGSFGFPFFLVETVYLNFTFARQVIVVWHEENSFVAILHYLKALFSDIRVYKGQT